jgi:hypothetical protein
MRLLRAAATALCVLVVLPTTMATSARADATLPAVGECFLVTDKQTFDDYWAGLPPVPCAERHSFEVTKSSALPADVNAITFAQDQCDVAKVWKQLGINQPRAGVVRNPIRIEAFYFVIRSAGSVKPSFVCGAGPVSFRGAKGAVLTTMQGALGAMSAATKSSLLYCNSAANGRSAYAPPITVPCSKTPRWQVLKWILWSSIYADYPGEDVMAASAEQMCGPGREYSYPTAANWAKGSKRTFCYTKFP